jgi:hypothetical protein
MCEIGYDPWLRDIDFHKDGMLSRDFEWKTSIQNYLCENQITWNENKFKLFFYLFRKKSFFPKNRDLISGKFFNKFDIVVYLDEDEEKLNWRSPSHIERRVKSTLKKIRIVYSFKAFPEFILELTMVVSDDGSFIHSKSDLTYPSCLKDSCEKEYILLSEREFMESNLLIESSEIFDFQKTQLYYFKKKLLDKFILMNQYLSTLKSDDRYIRDEKWHTLFSQIRERYIIKISFFSSRGFVFTFHNELKYKHLDFFCNRVTIFTSENSTTIDMKAFIKPNTPNIREFKELPVMDEIPLQQLLEEIFLT